MAILEKSADKTCEYINRFCYIFRKYKLQTHTNKNKNKLLRHGQTRTKQTNKHNLVPSASCLSYLFYVYKKARSPGNEVDDNIYQPRPPQDTSEIARGLLIQVGPTNSRKN